MAAAVVEFDVDEFRADYPQFTTELISDEQLTWYFTMAADAVGNVAGQGIPYDPDNGVYRRKIVLYLYVCHLATMALWPAGASGPLTSASEGSVSVGYSVYSTDSGDWFSQTPCGAQLWQLTMFMRTGGRYYGVRYRHPMG